MVKNAIVGIEALPKVGDGATICVGSDRYGATVVEVRGTKTVVIQYDDITPAPDHDYYAHQRYIHTPNPKAEKEVFTLRKNGYFVRQGTGSKWGAHAVFGRRDSYRDPSF